MLPSGIDSNDLSRAGWGVVFAPDEPSEVRAALRPLLDRRMEQAGDLYLELELPDGESAATFSRRHGVGPGVVDPAKLPYYLLLVGSPERISFDFQSQLSVQHAVGRLHLDGPSAYSNYARSVLRAEASEARARNAVFAAVQNPDDPATQATARRWVKPLVDSLTERFPDWTLEYRTDRQTSKAELRRLLNSPENPASCGSRPMAIGCHPAIPASEIFRDLWSVRTGEPGNLSQSPRCSLRTTSVPVRISPAR